MFRPTVLVERVDRVECIKEEDALRHFVRFLKNIGGNILIVGLDEETMGVLRKKLKKHSKKGNSVYLFTWWQRILKYRRFISRKQPRVTISHRPFLRSPDFDLESYSRQKFPSLCLPNLITAFDVACMLRCTIYIYFSYLSRSVFLI